MRLGGVFNKRRRDRELADELETHLQLHIEDGVRSGLTPGQARREALIKLGGLDSTKEACRDRGGLPLLENLLQDLRFGSRMLLRYPAFTTVAVLTLALGIGANTAIFSLANAVLFRPLPFHEPGRLVWITNPDAASTGIPGMTRSVNLRDWRELNQSFEELGCYIAWFGRQQLILTNNGESRRVEQAFVDPGFLKVLGVAPRLGRGFIEEDGQEALILTDTFWKRRFDADPDIVGKSITISGRPWAVVGVLPPSFDFSSIFVPGTKSVDFLRPSPVFGDFSDNTHAVIGRLKPGVTIRQAQLEFDRLNQNLRIAHPERGGFGALLSLLREHISGQFRRPLLVLACAVGCVLLIACVNISNLLLARAAARRKEIAVRQALGAGHGRLLRQMLTESILLAACGAALGLPLAYMATAAVAKSGAFGIPLLSSARVDGPALSFALLIACGAALVFGIVPALFLSNVNVQNDLQEASRGSSGGKGRLWVRKTLVVAEVAMACVLLVGAGLLIRSFVRILDVDLGFRPDQVASCRIRVSRDFATNTEQVAYFEDLTRRIAALPGVDSVGFTRTLPFNAREIVHVLPQGESPPPGEVPSVFIQDGDQGYFKTLLIPLLAGRGFDSYDQFFDHGSIPKSPLSALVNEKMARRLWPAKKAVGRMFDFFYNDPTEKIACQVIGVVGNVRQNSLELEAAPQLYLLGAGGQLVVRTKEPLSALAPDIRALLRRVGSDLILEDFTPLRQMVDQAVSPKRLIMLLVGLFSLLALLLASIGIYGVIAYSVSRRTQEIGIRLALGSPAASVLRLVIAEGMRLVLLGCAIGLVASLALTRVIQALLFGVSATDPLTILASGFLLLAVALLACWLPARRAARLDPMAALRCE